MNHLLLYKPGFLTAVMIKRAEKAGYCCIETNDFEAIKIVDASIPASKDELFKAAMFAIHNAGKKPDYENKEPRTIFGARVAEALSKSPT